MIRETNAGYIIRHLEHEDEIGVVAELLFNLANSTPSDKINLYGDIVDNSFIDIYNWLYRPVAACDKIVNMGDAGIEG